MTVRYLPNGSTKILDNFVNPNGWVGVTNYQERMSYRKGSDYLYSNMPYNGFNQLYRIAIEPTTSPTQFLTSGYFEVSDMSNSDPIACVTDDDSAVYYYKKFHNLDFRKNQIFPFPFFIHRLRLQRLNQSKSTVISKYIINLYFENQNICPKLRNTL